MTDLSALIERLEKNSIPEPNSGCHIWLGGASSSRSKMFYGNMRVGNRSCRAHRVAWEVANRQQVPDGMMVCHSCDNPLCINPDHLFIVTAKDNSEDCKRKRRNFWSANPEAARAALARGRSKIKILPQGERHGNAKLTDKSVLQIRELAASGISQREIAAYFGISQGVVSLIFTRQSWSHV